MDNIALYDPETISHQPPTNLDQRNTAPSSIAHDDKFAADDILGNAFDNTRVAQGNLCNAIAPAGNRTHNQSAQEGLQIQGFCKDRLVSYSKILA